eukprot:2605183-Rhodomonas_salina.1
MRCPIRDIGYAATPSLCRVRYQLWLWPRQSAVWLEQKSGTLDIGYSLCTVRYKHSLCPTHSAAPPKEAPASSSFLPAAFMTSDMKVKAKLVSPQP